MVHGSETYDTGMPQTNDALDATVTTNNISPKAEAYGQTPLLLVATLVCEGAVEDEVHDVVVESRNSSAGLTGKPMRRSSKIPSRRTAI